MDAFILQVLNGLDKGGAYALIALGLTLVFGTLGVVNFAHGALFMLGAFCAVIVKKVLTLERVELDPTQLTAWGSPVEIRTHYIEEWFGDFGTLLIDFSVPASIFLAIPIMLILGIVMERGLIRHFYKRPHADQILVTFGLAIVIQEIVKAQFGANPIPQATPEMFSGSADIGVLMGFAQNTVVYPWWRIIYLIFAGVILSSVFAFLQFTTFGMVVRAGMADRETVGLLGIDIDRKFTIVFGLAAVVAVGGMGSLGGAVAAGFLLGILQSFASMNEVKSLLPGIDQVIIYLIAVVVLLVRPRGLMGRKGVMED
jgi:branched-chain amino acid transport system permease protein